MSDDIKLIGIIGAGQMGLGIAQVLATSGFNVLINDRDQVTLNSAPNIIRENINKAINKGRLDKDIGSYSIDKIKTKNDIAQLGECDLIIEAATENEKIKHEIFKNLVPHLQPHTILTSNTSSISITRLAARTDRPEKFMGCHFMKPAPVMQLVELVRGIATTEEFPAFIVNRILLPMINEGIYALYDGVGTVESIDNSMRLGANHPMGPLELADFIGLDTCLAIMNTLHDGLADTKYRPCPLLVKYVEADWLGRKNKIGFYNYKGEKPVPTR